MATLTVQDLPANGVDLGNISFDACDVAGDVFPNTGKEIVIVKTVGAPSGDVTIEGVPAPDSGRDGTSVMTLGADELHIAGPFKSRNWSNSSGGVDLSYLSGITNMSVAVVRFTLG